MAKRKKEENRDKQSRIHNHKISKMEKKVNDLNKRYSGSLYVVEDEVLQKPNNRGIADKIARIRRVKGRRPHKVKRVK